MGRSARWRGDRFGIILICIVLFGSGIAFGKSAPPYDASEIETFAPDAGKASLTKSTPTFEAEFYLTSGSRSDDLQWSIAGSGINVLSELSWSDVESYQICMGIDTRLKNNIHIRGQFNYAAIMDGKVRDSDYGSNGAANEWSRSISESDGDQLWDITAGGGYAFSFLDKRLILSPMLGISYHKQSLRIQDGRQVLSETNPFGGSNPPPVGPLSNQLDSSYFARWVGPWVGCDLRYKPKMRSPVYHAMEFRFSMELHWADYSGEGNWNLRGDLQHPKSFEHEADGFGINITAQWLFHLADKWNITVSASHQDWSTGSGTDRKFQASGGSSTTQLNEVNWNSTSYMMGVVYRF
jgi:hypothetical protein